MKDESSALATADDLSSRSRDVEWYDKELVEVKPAAQELLEKYSNIPAEQVKEHIISVREKAWAIYPYPCIGGFRFLDLTLSTLPKYPDVLAIIKNGGKMLDLGCFFGQEMRKLIFDGAPSGSLYGADLRPEFFDLGYELFRDRHTCNAKFFAANVFEPSPELDALNGQLSVVYTGAFFHLFDRPEQLQIAKRVATLLTPKPGVMVLGRQVGNVHPGAYEHATNSGGVMYRHNEHSWQVLWSEVGRETDGEWEAWVELRETARFQKPGKGGDGARQMYFCVTRR